MQNYGYNPYLPTGYPTNYLNSYQYNTQQPQQTTQAQNITRIIPVSTKEEAIATPIDLVNGTPTFFYNKGTNEIYLKQFDVQSGTSTLKTFTQSERDNKPNSESKSEFDINTYRKDINYLKSGIDSLHKILSHKEETELEEAEMEDYTKPKSKKRGQ